MYKIGHGKPPIETRFKKGRSGNPNGRPRKVITIDDIVRLSLNKIETYYENGVAKTASRWELFIKKLNSDFLLGDMLAAKTLLRLLRQAYVEGPRELTIHVKNALPENKEDMKRICRELGLGKR